MTMANANGPNSSVQRYNKNPKMLHRPENKAVFILYTTPDSIRTTMKTMQYLTALADMPVKMQTNDTSRKSMPEKASMVLRKLFQRTGLTDVS